MTSTRSALAQLRAANPVITTRSPAATRSPAPHRRSRVGLLVAATAGASAVALVVVAVGLPQGAATPAAAAALDRAATAADITALDQQARPEQYWRITTAGIQLALGPGSAGPADGESSSVWLTRGTRVAYVAVDGSRPSWYVDSPTEVAEVLFGEPPADATGGPGQTWTTNLVPNDTAGSWQEPTQAWLAGLPRAPDQLRDRLYKDTRGRGRSHDGEVLVTIADALRSGVVPADLRAALFRVLETVPGVDIVQRHADGQISIGRLETRDGQREEIIIDPATGSYVGERTIQVQELGSIPAGTVIEDVDVTTTLVDQIPQQVRDHAKLWTCTPDGMCGQ
jgi:RNA polymerase sigma-70 factor (ECF subfamily)